MILASAKFSWSDPKSISRNSARSTEDLCLNRRPSMPFSARALWRPAQASQRRSIVSFATTPPKCTHVRDTDTHMMREWYTFSVIKRINNYNLQFTIRSVSRFCLDFHFQLELNHCVNRDHWHFSDISLTPTDRVSLEYLFFCSFHVCVSILQIRMWSNAVSPDDKARSFLTYWSWQKKKSQKRGTRCAKFNIGTVESRSDEVSKAIFG